MGIRINSDFNWSPWARYVLGYAEEEAKDMGEDEVYPEHIFLAFLRSSSSSGIFPDCSYEKYRRLIARRRGRHVCPHCGEVLVCDAENGNES